VWKKSTLFHIILSRAEFHRGSFINDIMQKKTRFFWGGLLREVLLEKLVPLGFKNLDFCMTSFMNAPNIFLKYLFQNQNCRDILKLHYYYTSLKVFVENIRIFFQFQNPSNFSGGGIKITPLIITNWKSSSDFPKNSHLKIRSKLHFPHSQAKHRIAIMLL